MSIILFANDAASTLAGSISNVATTCALAAGTGALFPNPGADEYFVMTFTDASTGLLKEIVHCTARATDTLTIVRAQEGTTALAWTAGDIAANLNTAGTMAGLVQPGDNPGRLLSTVSVTVSGAVAVPSGANLMIVEGVGGGGGGGGAATTTAGQFAVGGGGGSGSFGKVQVSSGIASLTATIGAGGAGGVSGAAGANAASTVLTGTFGTITFPGGGGGPAGNAFAPPYVNGGGAAGVLATQSGGTAVFLTGGDAGGIGYAMQVNNGNSGVGANSSYGTGGGEVGANADGAPGFGYGSGGSGGLNEESQVTARDGGDGAAGILIIQFYS